MNKKILIADDEDDLRLVLKDMFRGHPYELTFARNGEEAIKKLDARKLDLAILDISMPKAGGYEVCRHMKEDPVLKHIPIIILSAFTHDKAGDQASLANCYMHKPFDQDLLLRTVIDLLGNSENQNGLPSAGDRD